MVITDVAKNTAAKITNKLEQSSPSVVADGTLTVSSSTSVNVIYVHVIH